VDVNAREGSQEKVKRKEHPICVVENRVNHTITSRQGAPNKHYLTFTKKGNGTVQLQKQRRAHQETGRKKKTTEKNNVAFDSGIVRSTKPADANCTPQTGFSFEMGDYSMRGRRKKKGGDADPQRERSKPHASMFQGGDGKRASRSSKEHLEEEKLSTVGKKKKENTSRWREPQGSENFSAQLQLFQRNQWWLEERENGRREGDLKKKEREPGKINRTSRT